MNGFKKPQIRVKSLAGQGFWHKKTHPKAISSGGLDKSPGSAIKTPKHINHNSIHMRQCMSTREGFGEKREACLKDADIAGNADNTVVVTATDQNFDCTERGRTDFKDRQGKHLPKYVTVKQRFNPTPKRRDVETAETDKKKRREEELPGLRNAVTSTSDAVAHATDSVEEEKKVLTFSETAALLKPYGFNLEDLREKAVVMHERWGLVELFKKKGIVESTDQYSKLFDSVTFTEDGMRKLIERLKGWEKWYSFKMVFNPGHLKPSELWQSIFRSMVGGFMSQSDRGDGFREIDEIRKITPELIPGLMDLHNETPGKQLKAFRKAYYSAPSMTDTKPSIMMVSDYFHDAKEYSCKSATVLAQQASKGAQFVDLMSDWLCWRETVYRDFGKELYSGGDYPWPQYPLFVFSDGNIVSFHGDYSVDKMGLYKFPAHKANGHYLARVAYR